MGKNVRECFNELKKRFKDVDFRVGVASPDSHEKNTFIIDKTILEQMANDPQVAQDYEKEITLILELQKAFNAHKNKDCKSGKMVILH